MDGNDEEEELWHNMHSKEPVFPYFTFFILYRGGVLPLLDVSKLGLMSLKLANLQHSLYGTIIYISDHQTFDKNLADFGSPHLVHLSV